MTGLIPCQMNDRKNPLFIITLFLTLALAYGKDSVSSVGDEIIGCLVDCSTFVTDTDVSLRVISLNLYHGYPEFRNLGERLQLVTDQIRKSDADIVFLQEVPWHGKVGLAAESLAASLGFNFVYVRANGNYSTIRFEEGLAILSRFPLHSPVHTEIRPKSAGFENRAALGVTVDVNGNKINLVTTHLTRRKNLELNAAQAQSLMEFVESLGTRPAIVAGDFNADETSPQIRALNEEWMDAYRIANPGIHGPTCCLRRDRLDQEDPGQPRVRVDYVFLVPNGSDWLVERAEQIFNLPRKDDNGFIWASNHIGVLVDTLLIN